MTKLQPCAHCGLDTAHLWGNENNFTVECSNCSIMEGSFYPEEQAIELWNTRDRNPWINGFKAAIDEISAVTMHHLERYTIKEVIERLQYAINLIEGNDSERMTVIGNIHENPELLK